MTGSLGEGRTPAYPPFAHPDVALSAPVIVPEGGADPRADDDYPAIEQFIDELPSIEDYLADELEPAAVAGMPIATGSPATADEGAGNVDPGGWAVSDWQSFEWSSLAALGRGAHESAAADASWSGTQWTPVGESQTGASGATSQEVAAALDDIARRIRSGELSIEHFRGSPPEAAMAAALAALLRMRG